MASALALPALLAVGLAACGDDGGDAVSAFSVRSVAQGDTYRFEGLPGEIEGGTVTFTLDNADGGESPHEMQILQVDEGTTFEQVQAELLNSEEGAPFPDFVGEIAGGLGTVAPGGQGSVTQELDEGTYLYFCEVSDDEESEDAPTHADQGMQGMFTVDGNGADADEPDTQGAITLKEYAFELDDVEAGDNVVELKNEGNEYHHVVAAPLSQGATVEEALAFFQSEEEPTGPPPIDFERTINSAVVGPGQEIRTTLSFSAGQYVMACFITDRAGSEPHVAKGMVASTQIE